MRGALAHRSIVEVLLSFGKAHVADDCGQK